MSRAGLTKVETLFVLITKRSCRGRNHFREQTRGNKREGDTKNCHHDALLSKPDTTSKCLNRSPELGERVYNSTGLDEVGTT